MYGTPPAYAHVDHIATIDLDERRVTVGATGTTGTTLQISVMDDAKERGYTFRVPAHAATRLREAIEAFEKIAAERQHGRGRS